MKKLAVLWLWLLSGMCLAEAPMLPVEQAFPLQAEALDAQTVRLTWRIADGYFLLRTKFRLNSETKGISLGHADFPKAAVQQDDFFGPQEVYRGELRLELPLQRGPNAPGPLELSVTSQGCLGGGMEECYPPHTQRVSLALPALPVAPPKAAPAEEFAGGDDEFLDPEMAFVFSASQPAPDKLLARWEIADGYYLYRDKLQFALQNAAGLLGQPQLPPGRIKEDPLFGKVAVYEKRLEVELPLKDTGGLDHLVLEVKYQGCAEAGLCYPPTEKTHTFVLAQAAPDKPKKPDLSALAGQSSATPWQDQNGKNDLLEVDQAFRFDTLVEEPGVIVANWEIAEGYYLYRHKLVFKLTSGGTLGEYALPAGDSKDDPEQGKVEIYHKRLTVRLPVAQLDARLVSLHVEYQGCADGRLCYPPVKKDLMLEINAPATNGAAQAGTGEPLAEQDRIARILEEGNIFWIILSFFGFGLLLSLTPCVFPMIPILSGIIVGQGKHLTTRAAFAMSLVYVLAMALTYAVAGVIAGMLGENIQAALQNPWVLGSFAGVFVLLSLSMFGFYELQMPAGLQTRLSQISNRQRGGTLLGVAIMGFLSALIVGPCVAAPLAGALVYISQHGPLLGGLALFAMGLGMGAPLLIIGTSAGKLLPRAGAWMETVKYVFGVLLLAVAVWMLERVVPPQIALLLWALLLIVPAVYLGALDSLPPGASGWRKFWKGVGVFLLLWGALLVVGAAGGSGDAFQPLKGLSLPAAGNGAAHGLAFKRIKGTEGLDAELAAAQAQGKPVMLDFYADWCVSCKEMEKLTFADPGVQQALAGVVLLQADVTPNDAQDKALYQRFKIPGPPAIVFFGSDGQELKNYRVIGFMPAGEFRGQVEKALSASSR